MKSHLVINLLTKSCDGMSGSVSGKMCLYWKPLKMKVKKHSVYSFPKMVLDYLTVSCNLQTQKLTATNMYKHPARMFC